MPSRSAITTVIPGEFITRMYSSTKVSSVLKHSAYWVFASCRYNSRAKNRVATAAARPCPLRLRKLRRVARKDISDLLGNTTINYELAIPRDFSRQIGLEPNLGLATVTLSVSFVSYTKMMGI